MCRLVKVLINPLISGAHQTLEQHVIVYNPLVWNITTIINVTVGFPNAAVFDDDGQPVPTQVRVLSIDHYRDIYIYKFYIYITVFVSVLVTDPEICTVQRDL